MDLFYIIVLSIAVVFLIVFLTTFGLLMKSTEQTTAYPPTYSTCPDYWEIAQDGSKCIIPSNQSSLNVGSIYTSPNTLNPAVINTTTTPGYSYDISNNKVTNYIDFTNLGWKGICSKKTWAINNGIVWDGVSNYNSC